MHKRSSRTLSNAPVLLAKHAIQPNPHASFWSQRRYFFLATKSQSTRQIFFSNGGTTCVKPHNTMKKQLEGTALELPPGLTCPGPCKSEKLTSQQTVYVVAPTLQLLTISLAKPSHVVPPLLKNICRVDWDFVARKKERRWLQNEA